MEPALSVDTAQEHGTEVDVPVAIFSFRQAHQLGRQALADVDAFAAPADLTLVMHPTNLNAGTIFGLAQLAC